jgi:site-specific DNA-methyltransferase (adenine-specific)
MPNEYVDLTITSPPYDNLRDYKGYSFDFENTAKELFRITKNGGVVVWVVGDAVIDGSESGTSFRQALFFKEIGFNLHDTMIYAKKNTPPQPNTKRYEQRFEYMFVFSKGQPKTFNPQLKFKEYDDKRKMKAVNRGKDGKIVMREVKHKDYVKVGNVWFYATGMGNTTKEEYVFEHPATFPEKLVDDNIKSWSNEGDLVLDPFAGSGTTLKMAKLSLRKYIGIEISSEYCEIIKRRLQQETLFDVIK